MSELTNLIYHLRKIEDDVNTIQSIHYHLLMHVFQPYINKKNCEYRWRMGELFSKQVRTHYNLSKKIETPTHTVLPRYMLYCEKTHNLLMNSGLEYSLPMKVHFALFYHYRNPVMVEDTVEQDIEFLSKQVPGYSKPIIKNAYFFILDNGMCVGTNNYNLMTLQQRPLEFNIHKNPYKEIMVKNVTQKK